MQDEDHAMDNCPTQKSAFFFNFFLLVFFSFFIILSVIYIQSRMYTVGQYNKCCVDNVFFFFSYFVFILIYNAFQFIDFEFPYKSLTVRRTSTFMKKKKKSVYETTNKETEWYSMCLQRLLWWYLFFTLLMRLWIKERCIYSDFSPVCIFVAVLFCWSS